jgi:hypothetical protein
MLNRLRVPRDEEKERAERVRSEKLVAQAVHMMEAAIQRHDESMDAGHLEQADSFSETAFAWFAALTGHNG